jgi:SAM-dependent methyltransferase
MRTPHCRWCPVSAVDEVSQMPPRGELWREVWNQRDDDRADWNGCEACFDSFEDYQRWNAHTAMTIRDELNLTPADTVADLGCGTGHIAELVGAYVGRVLAYDYSAKALKVATDRRKARNIEFQLADLNELDPATLPVTKAFANGSLFYMNSIEHVLRLMRGLFDRGIAFAAIDLPDRNTPDLRERSYDTQVYSHLQFDPELLLREFPHGRIVRGMFPGYVNDAFRFSFFVDGKAQDEMR